MIAVNPKTYAIAGDATVSDDSTITFLGATWYCPGTEPGWRVTAKSTRTFNQARYLPNDTVEFPEITWEIELALDIRPHATPMTIAASLGSDFLEDPYLSGGILKTVSGFGFRLSPINTESNNTL